MSISRIAIIDDELDVRDGLEVWLAPQYEILTYDCAESFLTAIDNFAFEDGVPTCLLLDLQMPGMSGTQLQTRLKQINMDYPIIFMSGNANQVEIIDAWRGGAVDFILKPFNATQISDVLAKLCTTERNTSATPTSINTCDNIDQPAILITQREAQVLLLLAKGHRQHEVANTLGISLRTVKMYRTFLKNKLNLHTLIELARYCDKHQSALNKIAAPQPNN